LFQNGVKADCSAVAGFFEDLPVVVIVLAGVMTILLSASWAALRIQEGNSSELLREDADDALVRFLAEFARPATGESHPTVRHLQTINISAWARGHIESEWFLFSLVLVHPSWIILAQAQHGDFEHAISCGYSSGLLNALTDDGMVGIVKVNVLVWTQ
jgi:hypothetical protein